jgi:hypothetical protein
MVGIIKRIKESLQILRNRMITEKPQFNPQSIKPSGRSVFTKQEFKDEIVDVPGKPRIIAGVCEFCGIEAIKCSHYAQEKN